MKLCGTLLWDVIKEISESLLSKSFSRFLLQLVSQVKLYKDTKYGLLSKNVVSIFYVKTNCVIETWFKGYSFQLEFTYHVVKFSLKHWNLCIIFVKIQTVKDKKTKIFCLVQHRHSYFSNAFNNFLSKSAAHENIIKPLTEKSTLIFSVFL